MTIENTNVSRRTLVKGAAWSLPVVAVAAATPLAAASTVTNVGDFSIDGSCGALGIIGAGFDLTAGNVALPAGTVIDITTTGLANIGLFTVTGGTADVQLIGTTGNRITLSAPLAANQTLQLRNAVTVAVISTMTANVTLPSGSVAGSNAKPTGAINATLVLCTPS